MPQNKSPHESTEDAMHESVGSANPSGEKLLSLDNKYQLDII